MERSEPGKVSGDRERGGTQRLRGGDDERNVVLFNEGTKSRPA